MATEVWIRNPRLCIRECLEVGAENIVWDRGALIKYHVDPVKFMNLHYGQVVPWRSISLGDQGCTEYTSNSDGKHVACYPAWEYTNSWDSLLDMINKPAGDDPDRYWNDSEGKDLRPVEGQEHRIFILNTPQANLATAKAFYRELAALQRDHPEVILHVHGLYSFRVMFGNSFASVDIEPRDLAAHGKVYFPAGREFTVDKISMYPKWVKMLGFRPVELKIPRNRCMFNILSAGWAAKHYNDDHRWSLHGTSQIDPDAPFVAEATDSRIMLRNIKSQAGDHWLCDTCSIQLNCKLFREGAVCAVPDSEPVELAHFFGTRDSETIITGLGTLLAAQSHRVNRALESETTSFVEAPEKARLDPELTKLINGLFDRGVKLAKLVDPSLRAGPKVAINNNSNNRAVIAGASPAALMAAVVDELTSRGVARDDITPEMVMRIVADGGHAAIEAAVVESTDDDEWDDEEDESL